MLELELDTSTWRRVARALKPMGPDTVVTVSGSGAGTRFRGSDPAGLLRVEVTVLGPVPDMDASFPTRLLRAAADAVDPTVRISDRIIEIASGPVTWSSGLSTERAPAIPDLVGTKTGLQDLVRAVGPVSRGVDPEREQVPFRHVVVSRDGTVTGLSGGRLLLRGPGWRTGPERTTRIPATGIRALLLHKEDATVTVGERALLVEEPGSRTWVSTWPNPLPLEQFLDGRALAGLTDRCTTDVIITEPSIRVAISDHESAASTTVNLSVHGTSLSMRSDSCDTDVSGSVNGAGTDMVRVPVNVLARAVASLTGYVTIRWCSQFLLLENEMMTAFVLGSA